MSSTEPAPNLERLLGRALILKARAARAVARAATITPETADDGASAAAPAATAPAPPSSVGQILAQATALHERIARTRSEAAELGAAEARLALLERALVLDRAIEMVRERYERAVSESLRQTLIERLVELRKLSANTLAKVRLVPDVITV